MVLATAVPKNAPNKFIVAANMTALPGERTFVATTVAMEFAVSWKPLMNSNTNAAKITSNNRVNIGVDSGVFQDDLVGNDTGFTATVDCFFENVKKLFQQKRIRRIELARINFAMHFQQQTVGFGFNDAETFV